MVIIDTNIIIDHLRQQSRAQSIYDKLLKKYSRKNLAISTITIQELFMGQSTNKIKESSPLIKLLKGTKIYSHTTNIARHAGEITRDRKENIKFADAAIAATAVHYGAHLATLNTKDFVGISNLKLLKLPT
jgi:predicted nucleic acid-binding protein